MHTNDKESFLNKIQEMREDEFTNTVLVPLWGAMNFSCQFNGGAYEAGKDFIAYKMNHLGTPEFYVSQVKKFKSVKKKDIRHSYSEYMYQIRQCLERKIKHIDGQEYFPRDVAFITPFEINYRILEEQFESLGLKNNRGRIDVLDGGRIYELVKKYKPSILDGFFNISDRLSHLSSSELINSELVQALSIQNEIDYSNFYVDLDFFVGRMTLSSLLKTRVIPVQPNQKISIENWSVVKGIVDKVEKRTGVCFLALSFLEVEDRYRKSMNDYESVGNQAIVNTIRKLKEKYLSTLREALEIVEGFRQELVSESSNKKQIDKKELRRLFNLLEEAVDPSLTNGKVGSINLDEVRSILKDVEAKFGAIGIFDKGERLWFAFKSAHDIAKEYAVNKKKVLNLPEYKVEFALDELLADIDSRINWYRNKIISMDDKVTDLHEIKEFLKKIEDLLIILDSLWSVNKIIVNLVEFKPAEEHGFDRLKLSTHLLFESGANMAVYGQAGAGKTTTLQMYAKKLINSMDKDELVIFIPLNRLVAKLDNESNAGIYSETPLYRLLALILNYKSIDVSEENIKFLIELLKSKNRVVIILDGLDEAVKSIPWVTKAIDELTVEIGKVQLIVSSRDCIRQVKEIDFIGITLLPFTKEQLFSFIRGWINDKESSEDLIRQVEERGLVDVIKNPLLATIVCNLHDSTIAIPANEPEIYRSKIGLLCGNYDQRKKIIRVANTKDILETAARKIAFQLHSRGEREASYDEIEDMLANCDKFNREKAREILNELVDPCNILIKNPFNNLYSFGHLRIQEFLAADEILRNRSIQILPLLNKEWWKGVLYLYAFEGSFKEVIDLAVGASIISESYDNLSEMIKACPIREQKSHKKLLRSYRKQEESDYFVNEGSIYD